jgi:hypothetical protein
MRIPKSIRILTVFIALVVVINLISAPKFVEANWAPKKPAYQLVDANGILIGVVVADEKTGPVIHNNRVTVFAGGNALNWNLLDGGNDLEDASEHINVIYRGANCVEPWFYLNSQIFNYRWGNSMWLQSGDEFKIPSDMSTRSGDFSKLVEVISQDGRRVKECIGPTTNQASYVYPSDKAWNIKKLETNVLPSRASLTWPLRVVPDKEVNGPLFFNTSYGITIYSNGRLKTNEERGSFCFSASEPYLYFDVIAKNSKGKTVKTWKNQRTGLWGHECVSKYLENETIQSITKYKFSLIYKGKVVAKLP